MWAFVVQANNLEASDGSNLRSYSKYGLKIRIFANSLSVNGDNFNFSELDPNGAANMQEFYDNLVSAGLFVPGQPILVNDSFGNPIDFSAGYVPVAGTVVLGSSVEIASGSVNSNFFDSAGNALQSTTGSLHTSIKAAYAAAPVAPSVVGISPGIAVFTILGANSNKGVYLVNNTNQILYITVDGSTPVAGTGSTARWFRAIPANGGVFDSIAAQVNINAGIRGIYASSPNANGILLNVLN